jgi:hypothetical protein
MAAVMTILQANVLAEDSAELPSRWREMAESPPKEMSEGWLVQGLDGDDTWCAVAIWSSEQALKEYRASVDVPAAVAAFRSVNARPALATFKIIAEA